MKLDEYEALREKMMN